MFFYCVGKTKASPMPLFFIPYTFLGGGGGAAAASIVFSWGSSVVE